MKKPFQTYFIFAKALEKTHLFFSKVQLIFFIYFCFVCFTIAQQIAEKLCFFIILNILPECMDVIYPSNDKSNAEGTIT